VNPFALLDPAVSALHSALVALASAVPAAGAGVRFTVALALVTVAVRALLLPLSIRALRLERRRAALAPTLAALRRRHAKDPRRLLAETARVQREAGVSAGGALALALAQLPVTATVYRLVVVPTVAGSPNLLLAAHLFGAPLAAHWPEVLAAGGLLGPGTFALLALLAALTLLAVASARDAARRAEEARAAGTVDGAAAGVERALRLLPFGTVLFALVAPVALGVHLVTTTAWTVAERRLLPRLVPA
jgi:YidC/Oxa1 family membrane protein insertase